MTTPSPSAFDPQTFEGTAEYYAVGRPPYSAQLADTMARELSLDGTGQLLDVGCGPGVLVLPLARLFDQVTALDPEPGMLQAGQRRCQQAGVANVRWARAITSQPGTRASRHALRTPCRRPGSAARAPSTRLGAPT